MPRHARIDAPELLQHVIVRGIEKRPIFLDDQDCEDLINQVADHRHVERIKLSQPSKERHLVRAKALICYVAIREWGLKGVDVAAALSHAAKRGARLRDEEKDLYVLLNSERSM